MWQLNLWNQTLDLQQNSDIWLHAQALASSEALLEYLRLVTATAETARSVAPPLLCNLRDCLESLQPNTTSTRTVDSEYVLSAVRSAAMTVHGMPCGRHTTHSGQ